MADDPKFRQGREGNLGQGQLGEGREPDLQKGDRSKSGASGFGGNLTGPLGLMGGGETAGNDRAEQSIGPQGGRGLEGTRVNPGLDPGELGSQAMAGPRGQGSVTGLGGQQLQDRNNQQYGSRTQGGLNKREDDPSNDVE